MLTFQLWGHTWLICQSDKAVAVFSLQHCSAQGSQQPPGERTLGCLQEEELQPLIWLQ